MITTIISFLTAHWAVSSAVGGGLLSVLTAALPFAGNLLSGGTLTYIKWGIMAFALLAVAGLSFYLTSKYYQNEIAGLNAKYITAAAKANAQAQAQEKAYQDKANQYIAQAQADVQKAQASESTIRKVIYATPKSYACSRSPAVQSLLNWMRDPAASR